jgi:hypothetical protein
MIPMEELDSMTDEQFEHKAFRLIVQEFGIGGLARFVRLRRSGPGDYTAERQIWQSHITLEDIEREMKSEIR